MFRKTVTLFSLSLISTVVIAAPTHYIVAPECLIEKTQTQFETLAHTNALSLIKTNQAGVNKLIAAKIVRSATPCGGFMDVTSEWNLQAKKKALNAKTFLHGFAYPKQNLTTETYDIKYQEQVNKLLTTMKAEDITKDLTHLTSRDNRYADSRLGVKTAHWIKGQVLTMAKDNGRTDVSSFFVKTDGFKQPSVVIKLGDSNEPGIVLGAHMDTLDSNFELKPGADDDGSGTSSLLEVARTLMSSGMSFNRPIYLIWYAAEEEGLYGSQNVVRHFTNNNIPVAAVLQLDMTGYADQNDPTIYLITDNVSKDLTAYIEKLTTTYVNIPVSYTRCGYSCSDHASWNKAGVNAAFPFEASFGHDDPYIHTAKDTMDVLSLDHMMNFAKLGTAFAVELAEPKAE